MRCRECEKVSNKLFGLFRGLLTGGVSKRLGGRRIGQNPCQSIGSEKVERPTLSDGVAFRFALGLLLGHG